MICPACDYLNKEPTTFEYTPTTLDKLKIFDEKCIYCCNNCGFGMIETDVSEEDLKEYYSTDYSGKARKYAETKSVDLRTKYSIDIRSISQLTLIKHYCNIRSDFTIIEIGAGAGGFLFLLRQMGFKGRYVAFEPQRQAHEYLEQLQGEVEREVFSQKEAIKYKDSVDLVVMSHALEHFNPGKILEVFCGVRTMLKQGGIFFCEVPNANLKIFPNAGERVVPHLSFFSLKSLKYFTSKSGMKLVFLNTCGDSQVEKDHDQQIKDLDRKGYFVFDHNPSDIVLRNRKYHLNLEMEKNKQRKIQYILSIAFALLGKKNVFSILDLIRRFKQKPYHSMIASKHFSYREDMEFIRMLSVK